MIKLPELPLDDKEIIQGIKDIGPELTGAMMWHINHCEECKGLYEQWIETIVRHMGGEEKVRHLRGG